MAHDRRREDLEDALGEFKDAVLAFYDAQKERNDAIEASEKASRKLEALGVTATMDPDEVIG